MLAKSSGGDLADGQHSPVGSILRETAREGNSNLYQPLLFHYMRLDTTLSMLTKSFFMNALKDNTIVNLRV